MRAGSITPEAQPGNPKPRAFRLLEHGAVINRYGFNSRGADNAAVRLQIYQERRSAGFADAHKVLAVNLGKNKLTENAADDYCIGIEKLSPFADIVVVNISSPNTPGALPLSLHGKCSCSMAPWSQGTKWCPVTDPSACSSVGASPRVLLCVAA